ncbi:CDP-diacylglycerol--glycerol-3-phosphate 3-phosphatidyltransferase 2-like protein [Cinnamomum micranthum f. kanehirae]|uniref:CDP-diacylglycerol--glycerol-3-phosphate 3-phosphatidyltransferase 2-like protein n=1 Tax=Cinnamomum micranthum f. kanehirae TaxID=337451 RepID=A0A443PXM3_9MAGN|nr:CDP-diacylglycerol--glycerol-3-phosphate 3-phosphatidyltransferase 2-like protein [Cinnamomum micranthum f. kanehirae]
MSKSPRAMESLVVSRRRSRNGERMSEEGWRLVSCGHFGGAAAETETDTEKDFGCRNSWEERRDLVANDMPDHVDSKEGGRGGFEENREPKKLLTLPTILTIGRVAAIPVFVITFYMNGWWATTATTSIFIMAAVTDWLDGYIARKMRLGTAFGAFLDPVADKLMVAATLVLLCTKPLEVAVFGQVPWLLTLPAIATIGREITMSAVREWAASQNGRVLEAVAVNNLGKWKTAAQMTALIILLATRDSSLLGQGVLAASGIILLYISAGLSVWSLLVYVRKIWRVLLK